LLRCRWLRGCHLSLRNGVRKCSASETQQE
jgi:hypothetical protein